MTTIVAGVFETEAAAARAAEQLRSAGFEHADLEWEKYVQHDERYERPTEVDALIGDYAKAERELGWVPQVKTPELVKIMVDADIQLLDDELSGRLARADR